MGTSKNANPDRPNPTRNPYGYYTVEGVMLSALQDADIVHTYQRVPPISIIEVEGVEFYFRGGCLYGVTTLEKDTEKPSSAGCCGGDPNTCNGGVISKIGAQRMADADRAVAEAARALRRRGVL